MLNPVVPRSLFIFSLTIDKDIAILSESLDSESSDLVLSFIDAHHSVLRSIEKYYAIRSDYLIDFTDMPDCCSRSLYDEPCDD